MPENFEKEANQMPLNMTCHLMQQKRTHIRRFLACAAPAALVSISVALALLKLVYSTLQLMPRTLI